MGAAAPGGGLCGLGTMADQGRVHQGPPGQKRQRSNGIKSHLNVFGVGNVPYRIADALVTRQSFRLDSLQAKSENSQRRLLSGNPHSFGRNRFEVYQCLSALNDISIEISVPSFPRAISKTVGVPSLLVRNCAWFG